MTSKMNTGENKRQSLASNSNHTFAMNMTNMSQHTLEDEDEIDLSLHQVAFFNFTTNSFLNNYYNFVIEYWAEAINQIAIPQLTGKSGIDIQDKNSIEELRKRLLNRIFQNGKLDLIFKKAQKFCDKHMFKITSNLTEGNSIRVIEGAREKEVLKEIEKLEAEIIKLRIQINLVKEETEKAISYRQFLSNIKEV